MRFLQMAGQRAKWQRALLGLLLLTSCAAALFVWRNLGLYSDEVAFRMDSARDWVDAGIVHGLYPWCASRSTAAPVLFLIPAWLFSAADQELSHAGMRVLPWLAAMLTCLVAIAIPIRADARGVACIVLSGLMGIAGSALVIARPEFVLLVQVASGLAILYWQESGGMNRAARYSALVLLLIILLCSLYVHLQGLLFMPFSLFVGARLLRAEFSKKVVCLTVVAVALPLAMSCWQFQHNSCEGHPLLEQFWAAMQFQPNQMHLKSPAGWMLDKLDRYADAFRYKAVYPVKYLPPIFVTAGWRAFAVARLNDLMSTIAIVNLLAPCIALGLIGSIRAWLHFRSPATDENVSNRASVSQLTALALLAAAPMVLFLDDSVLNFYRVISINLISALILCVLLSHVSRGGRVYVVNTYATVCTLAFCISIALNQHWFEDRLAAGYVGPSVAIDSNWERIRAQVNSLATQCNITVPGSHIAVDDTTYEALKRSAHLSAISYLRLGEKVEGVDLMEMFKQAGARSFIGLCGDWPIPQNRFRHQEDTMCCYNFDAASLSP